MQKTTQELLIEKRRRHVKRLVEQRTRMFLALVKYFDNYVTPLGCNVACYKSKKTNTGDDVKGKNFILGMIVRRPHFDASRPAEELRISYSVPLKYWHMAKVPVWDRAAKWSSKDSLDGLLRL